MWWTCGYLICRGYFSLGSAKLDPDVIMKIHPRPMLAFSKAAELGQGSFLENKGAQWDCLKTVHVHTGFRLLQAHLHRILNYKIILVSFNARSIMTYMPLVQQGKAIQWSDIMWGGMAMSQLTTELFPPVMQVSQAIKAFRIPKVFYWSCHTCTDPKRKWLQMLTSQNNVPTLLA